MDRKEIKILWRHPNIRDYRVPLFDLLQCRYDIHFLLTRPSKWDKKYNHTIFCSNDNKSLWFDFRSLKLFIRKLIKEDYNILVSSFASSSATIIATLVAKLRRKKVIIWEERWVKKPGTRFKLTYLLLKSFYFPLIDAFFVCGLCQKEYLKSLGIEEKKIFTSNESSLDISKTKKRKIDLGIDIRNKKIVLYLGRIIDCKGLEYLLEAFRSIENIDKNTFLLVVGDGDYKSRYLEMAKKLKLTNYKFIGEINDAKVKSYIYHLAHVVVLPSIITTKVSEGGPIVVPEALSTSTPIIASDAIGSTSELIENGCNGYIVKSENSKELADKILFILNNPDYRSMCKAARLTYEIKCDYNIIKRVFSLCLDSVIV